MELKKRNKIIIIALGAVLAIVGIVMAVMNSGASERVSIVGLRDTLPEAKGYMIDNVESTVYQQLNVDLGASVEIKRRVSGNIREESFYAFKDYSDVRFSKFIVDIENYKRSYMVLYGSNNSVTLFCLSDPDDIIYSESACGNSMAIDQSEMYLYFLPYQYTLDDGRDVTLSFSDGKEVIAVVDSCNKTIDKAPIIAKAKEWVEGYGLNSADFTYKVPLSYSDCLMK